MSGQMVLLGLLLSGFFAVACMRCALPGEGNAPVQSPRDLLRLPGRLERLRRSRWQWFAMVALMIVLRLQQQLPVVLELMAAVLFLLFLALPAKHGTAGGRRALSH